MSSKSYNNSLPQNEETSDSMINRPTFKVKKNTSDASSTLQQSKSQSASVTASNDKKGASPIATIISIVKNVVGAGLLPLPLTLYSGTPLMAFTVMLILAVINCMTFWLLGVLSEGKCSSYAQVWERCIGKRSKVIPILFVAMNGTITCCQYTVVIAAQLPLALGKENLKQYITESDSMQKLIVLAPIVGLIIFPLCLLTNLEPLKYPSLFGLICTAFAILLVVIDSMQGGFFGDYLAPNTDGNDPFLDQPNGGFTANEFQNSVMNQGGIELMPLLGIISLYSSAYACHYNSPKWYQELDKNWRNPKSYAIIAIIAFIIVIFIFALFMYFGYSRFGPMVQDNILKDFEIVSDKNILFQLPLLISVAWAGMAFSVTTSYPLLFNSCRQHFFLAFEMIPILGPGKNGGFGFNGTDMSQSSRVAYWSFTAAFCFLTLIGGWQIESLGFLGSLKGFTSTNFLCGLFPGLMLLGKIRGWGDRLEGEEEDLEGEQVDDEDKDVTIVQNGDDDLDNDETAGVLKRNEESKSLLSNSNSKSSSKSQTNTNNNTSNAFFRSPLAKPFGLTSVISGTIFFLIGLIIFCMKNFTNSMSSLLDRPEPIYKKWFDGRVKPSSKFSWDNKKTEMEYGFKWKKELWEDMDKFEEEKKGLKISDIEFTVVNERYLKGSDNDSESNGSTKKKEAMFSQLTSFIIRDMLRDLNKSESSDSKSESSSDSPDNQKYEKIWLNWYKENPQIKKYVDDYIKNKTGHLPVINSSDKDKDKDKGNEGKKEGNDVKDPKKCKGDGAGEKCA